MKCKNPYVKGSGTLNARQMETKEQRILGTPFGCGQCFACRINKAREWSHRILLESMVHDHSCFVTLTYNAENLPKDLSLKKDDLRNFIRALRKRIYPRKIRYFGVGEYGDKTWRPHYHAILFGVCITEEKTIEKVWKKGFVFVGDCNKDTARYCCGYVTKKLTNRHDASLNGKEPEFMSCSKQSGGIGLGAIRQIAEELLRSNHFKRRVIREISYGKRNLPLGRYLTGKLSELLGIDQSVLDNELENYQREIFEEYADCGLFKVKKLIEDTTHDRLVQKKKFKLWKARRKL